MNNRQQERILNAFRMRLEDGYSSYDGELDEYADDGNEDYEDLLELDEEVIDPVPEELLA